MNSFTYLIPTKVIFGNDAMSKLGEQLLASNATKVLVLYGGGSVIKNGILAQATKALIDNKIAYVELGGVQPNPILSLVREGKELCIKEKVDFILSVGGGSTIDTAKAISLAVGNPTDDVWDYFCGKGAPKAAIPNGCVLTIAAAGSETSDSAVITNADTKEKRGMNSDLFRCTFAILNPEFTYTLPKFQVTCGIVDILMHTFDRYFSKDMDNETSDQIAEGLIRTVLQYGKQLAENPSDAKAASEIMWCGSLSHNGITGLGNIKDFSPHRLGRDISGLYDSAHGATLSVAWVGFANYTVASQTPRFARFGRNIFGLTGNDEQVAKEAIAKMTEFYASIDMPITLTELLGHPVTDEEIAEISLAVCQQDKNATFGTFFQFTYDDVVKLFTSVR
ncbi:MAG: iron-containing alcohol dehydrogenase [Eubacteriales bacterium]